MLLLCKFFEIAQEFFFCCSLREDFQMFAKGDRFSGNQLKSIADQKTVKMAGIWAASDQMGIVNKLDLAAFCADHLQRIPVW